eukprot:TRINITY_DN11285_c1_g4_i1.p1 TRINITY_DN11285_c1_g4~~TRINITY_DN11285_c1_g4_i1.p1  ORF type:complete len:1537 (-),score=554.30 TRINITY_DN11285_c1_g4_i1:474-4448(-)
MDDLFLAILPQTFASLQTHLEIAIEGITTSQKNEQVPGWAAVKLLFLQAQDLAVNYRHQFPPTVLSPASQLLADPSSTDAFTIGTVNPEQSGLGISDVAVQSSTRDASGTFLESYERAVQAVLVAGQTMAKASPANTYAVAGGSFPEAAAAALEGSSVPSDGNGSLVGERGEVQGGGLTESGKAEVKDLDGGSGIEGTFHGWNAAIQEQMDALHLARVQTAVQQVVATAVNLVDADSASSDGQLPGAAAAMLQQLAALLLPLQLAGLELLFALITLNKSMGKLGYILGNLFCTLLAEGFCAAKEEADGGEGGEDGNFVEGTGTGMGEGEGKKDVSDEIEDEEQLLGTTLEKELQEQEKEKEGPKEDKNDSKGVEMQQDFEGEMFDLSEDEEDVEGEEEDEGEGEKEERLEQEMGDLGEDADVVDEKLWGKEDDEKDGKEQKGEEKFEKDAPISGAQDDEIEYRGKEEEEGSDGKEQEDEKGGKQKEKEGQGKKGEKDEDKKAENETDGGGEEEGEGEEREEGEEGEDKEGEEEDGGGEKPGQTEESHGIIPHGDEDMELPEDMELDGDEKGEEEGEGAAEEGGIDEDIDGGKEGEEEGKADDKEKESEDTAQEEEAAGKQEEGGEEGGPQPEEEGADQDMDGGEDEEEVDEGEQKGGEGGKVEEVEEEKGVEEEDGGARPGEDQGVNVEGAVDDFSAVVDKQMGQGGGEEAVGVRAVGGGGGGRESQGADNREEEREGAYGEEERKQRQEAQMDKGGRGKETAAAKEERSAKEKRAGEKQSANPQRQLGEIFRKWKERVQVVGDGEKEEEGDGGGEREEEEQREEEGEDAMDAEYEYTGEDSGGNEQALGPATEEQLERRGEMETKEGDDERNESDQVPNVDELVEKKPEEEQVKEEERRAETGDANRRKAAKLGRDEMKDFEGEEDEEERRRIDAGTGDGTEQERTVEDDKEMRETIVDESFVANLFETHARLNGAQEGEVEASESELRDQENEEEKEDFLSEEELRKARAEAEVAVAELKGVENEEEKLEKAKEVWQKYEHITGRLSQELTEQLRLILEPTLATRLQGDFRSGKRINMKKVIPYIASQFRKDKIWLRRTKADKRQYQVVLAIDDSRSMGESHCGHLALEAMACICRAMSRLEVGEMAVVAFGEKERVRLVHGFEEPFTQESGAKVVSQFSFRQDNTIADQPVVELLRFLSGVLEEAAARAQAPASSSAPLQQLVLIIADGRFHEKESLRRCIREALRQRQLLAFIVLDNPEDSILDMQSVSFSGGGAPKFTKYLDSFPFPYYILLKDIDALPRTLANLLRQWFELMQGSSAS